MEKTTYRYDMTPEWAEDLAKKGIIYEDKGDSIIFYDPGENPNHVVIRECKKDQKSSQYISRRIGVMTFDDFKKLSMKTEYKGYTIESETEPWAIILGKIFRYYPIGESVGEGTKYTSTIEEAKEEIDELIAIPQ